MDKVLSEQPPDTWDSFPLFQILNDYLRLDGEFLFSILIIVRAIRGIFLGKKRFTHFVMKIQIRRDFSRFFLCLKIKIIPSEMKVHDSENFFMIFLFAS